MDLRSRNVYVKFYHICDNMYFSLKFRALSDADGWKSNYCPCVARIRIKQH